MDYILLTTDNRANAVTLGRQMLNGPLFISPGFLALFHQVLDVADQIWYAADGIDRPITDEMIGRCHDRRSEVYDENDGARFDADRLYDVAVEICTEFFGPESGRVA